MNNLPNTQHAWSHSRDLMYLVVAILVGALLHAVTYEEPQPVLRYHINMEDIRPLERIPLNIYKGEYALTTGAENGQP